MRSTDASSNSSNVPNETARDPYSASPSRKAGPSSKVLAAWTLLLEEVQLDDPTTAQVFLKNLARGHADGARTAQAVFNDLIAHEAYGLFGQVFAATNTVLKAQAEADGKAFTSTLVLKLPPNWKPSAPALMHETFAAAQVQRVEVLRPDPADDLDGLDELDEPEEQEDLSGPEESKEPLDVAISEAVCDVLATLLKAGASALVVRGVLADPAGVRDAMRASESLQALELGEVRLQLLTASEKECYETLLAGWKSARLKHLTLRQADIFAPLQNHTKAELPSWPALASLNLEGILVSSIPRVQWLVSVTTQSPVLKEVSLSFVEAGTHRFIEPTLARLKHHRSLTHVTLQGAAISPNSPSCLRVLDLAIEVAHSCRAVTHFAWDSGNQHVGGAAVAMARNFSFMDIRDWLHRPSPAVEAALGDPDFKLEWLSMTGMYFSSGAMGSFLRGVSVNKSLRGFDFSRSSVCARATTILPTSLKTNHTLRAPVLPKHPGDLFVVMDPPAAAIRALTQGPNRSDRVDATGHRRIRDDIQLARVEANAYQKPEHPTPLDADLKEHLDTLQQSLHERQLAFQPNAFPELTLDIAQLMASSGGLDQVVTSTLAALPDVAKQVGRFLENDGALRAVVRLSEVSKAVDHRDQHTRDAIKRRHPDVEPYVRLQNAAAVARALPGAPLPLNKRDANGANEQLMGAVRVNNPRLLRQLLAQGAVDFGGRAARAAPPGPLRNSFRAVNRVDETGANAQLLAAVMADDARRVRELRLKRAVDYGGRALNEARKKSPETLAAMARQ